MSEFELRIRRLKNGFRVRLPKFRHVVLHHASSDLECMAGPDVEEVIEVPSDCEAVVIRIKIERTMPRVTGIPIAKVEGLSWEGSVPLEKWMKFHRKVLSRFHAEEGLKLTVKVEARPEGGMSNLKVEATRTALKMLGLSDEVKTEGQKVE